MNRANGEWRIARGDLRWRAHTKLEVANGA